MSTADYTTRLVNDFDLNNQLFSKTIKIFRRSPYGYRILLEVMRGHYQLVEEKITIEYLAKILQHLSSRITVNKFIKYAIEKKLLEHQSDKTDSRLKFIIPSKILVKDYEHWVKIIFNG